MTIKRRRFLLRASQLLGSLASACFACGHAVETGGAGATARAEPYPLPPKPLSRAGQITLFVCGDVMTGRGIDQVLPYPSHPRIYESYLKSAIDYVLIAEEANGPIPRPQDFNSIWGDALEALSQSNPDVRLINLETSVTTSEDYWPGKGINYRMHPRNIPCLTAADIDACALANNHVLDWGFSGLTETLATLDQAGLAYAGAGADLAAAKAPAVIELENKTNHRHRLLLFSAGVSSSGIPTNWAAQKHKPGVHLLPDLKEHTLARVSAQIEAVKQPGDIAVYSIHWGGNWGYTIAEAHQRFARGLIDSAAIDLVHGHSSHHAKGIEVYRGKPIIYGCGDFLNDYEGIHGHEQFRGDLSLLYFVTLDLLSGQLIRFDMIPMQIRQFRLNRASDKDTRWLAATLTREGQPLGTRVIETQGHQLTLDWH